MAISAYTGLPGSGKSYGVLVYTILPALEAGRTVVTNIVLNQEAIAGDYPMGKVVQLSNDEFDSSDPYENADYYGAVFVIDEAWRFYPAGTRANDLPSEKREFLAEHRHRVDESGNTTEVCFVTQDLAQMAAFPRQLIETTYRVAKLSTFGAPSRFKVQVCSGAITGSKVPKSQLLKTGFDKYKKQYFKYYQSATQSKSGGVGLEIKTDKRSSLFSSATFYLIVSGFLAVVVFIPMAVSSFQKVFGGAPKPEVEIPTEIGDVTLPLINHSSKKVENFTPSRPEERLKHSKQWRLTGRVTHSHETFFIADSDMGSRLISDAHCEAGGIQRGLHEHCELDGELVTTWTGTRPRDFMSQAIYSQPPLASGASIGGAE